MDENSISSTYTHGSEVEIIEVLVDASQAKFVFDRTFRWKRLPNNQIMLIWPLINGKLKSQRIAPWLIK